MFVACEIWCLADVSSVSPSSEQSATIHTISTFVDQTHIQRSRPRRKTVFFKTSLRVLQILLEMTSTVTIVIGNDIDYYRYYWK